MHILLRILSIGSLLIVLLGVLFIGGGLIRVFVGGVGAVLRTLLAGAVITLIGLAAYAGLWAWADRLESKEG